MSKEFRPIFRVGNPTSQIAEFRSDIQKLTEERNRLERELSGLLKRLQELEGENTGLREEIKNLRERLQEKEEELERVSKNLADRENVRRMAEELADKVTQQLRGLKDSLRNDFVHIAREVIREFLMTDVLPKEEVVTKVLEEVFTRVTDLKGSVKVYLNPQNVDGAYEFTGAFNDKISGRIEIEILTDSSLREGEVVIETPKFVIERKHDEILEEIFREVLKRVLEGS